MIFIIPFILGAAAFTAAAAGFATGVDGVSKMHEAEEIGKEAQRRHERQRKKTQEKFETTQDLAEEYGKLQLDARQYTIGRFVKFIERIGKNASQSDMRFLQGLEGASPQRIKEYKSVALEAEKFAQGGISAMGAAYAAGQGTLALVGLFGTASTGVAIGGLSGAAAWNATLAFLGGGSLAAGGGGMALGTLVLGGIAVGPALMIGGFVLAGEGEKALTKAKEFEAKANADIAKLQTFEEFLYQVQRRIRELDGIVESLSARAIRAMDELESKPFDIQREAGKFQQVALLVKALSEIVKTPILNTEGEINTSLGKITEKYNSI